MSRRLSRLLQYSDDSNLIGGTFMPHPALARRKLNTKWLMDKLSELQQSVTFHGMGAEVHHQVLHGRRHGTGENH
jgi:hypothetical protein